MRNVAGMADEPASILTLYRQVAGCQARASGIGDR
jgi:hypothetical protein